MLGVSLFISRKNKIQGVCVKKKKEKKKNVKYLKKKKRETGGIPWQSSG